MQGIVTNIQRFSVHDGPGIRTTVFLKGCNLRCFWCHNPEDMNPDPEIQFFPERCIECGACLDCCVHGAHSVDDGQHRFRRELCSGCGECVDTCYAKGLVLVGASKSVKEVVDEILQDQAFYAASGGGVTLSGGEPLLQIDFSTAVLELCQARGIHTAIETAANFPWARVEAILPHVDLVMMDIKHMDSAAHRRSTGVRNERILENAARLGRQPQPLIVRTPVIPGVNDSASQICAIAAFVATLPNLLYYELLPYHPMAESKYRSLGQLYRATDLVPPTTAHMASLAEAASEAGVTVRLG